MQLGIRWAPTPTLVLTVFLASVVMAVGWRLHTSDLSPAGERRIAGWVLVGCISLVTIEILVLGLRLLEGQTVAEPVLGLLVNGSIGSLAGFVIGTRTHTLHRRERDLQRETDRLESIIKIVSHDLRNPLIVAVGRLELAREECDSDHLDDVRMRLDRMQTLIEDTLTVGRAGDTSLDMTELDLDRVVERCWTGVPSSDSALRIETTRSLLADEAKLKQLLENLLRNAVEHGGQDVTVTVGDLEEGFYVEDDGRGIPADERENVFETGYSVDDDGTGLGLVVVEQTANAHGWEVRATTGSDGGARFEITGVDEV